MCTTTLSTGVIPPYHTQHSTSILRKIHFYVHSMYTKTVFNKDIQLVSLPAKEITIDIIKKLNYLQRFVHTNISYSISCRFADSVWLVHVYAILSYVSKIKNIHITWNNNNYYNFLFLFSFLLLLLFSIVSSAWLKTWTKFIYSYYRTEKSERNANWHLDIEWSF
jgi:hypothetical protein